MAEIIKQIFKHVPQEQFGYAAMGILLLVENYYFLRVSERYLNKLDDFRESIEKRMRVRDERLIEVQQAHSEDLDDFMEILRDLKENVVRVTEVLRNNER